MHLGGARQGAVDPVDEERQPEPGETGREVALDRRIEREHRDSAAGGREDVDGEPRRLSYLPIGRLLVRHRAFVRLSRDNNARAGAPA